MTSISFPYMGEIYSILSSLIWSFAVIAFRKISNDIHPRFLNSFKNIIGLLFMIPFMFFVSSFNFKELFTIDTLLLVISGILGIGIADTLFFQSLRLLGASLYSITVCLYSGFVLILSYIFLHERLVLSQILGIVIIVLAIVISTYIKNRKQQEHKKVIKGLLYSTISMFFIAVSIIIMKPILSHYPTIQAINIRILSGSLFLFASILTTRETRKTLTAFHMKKKDFMYLLIGSFLGMFLATFFWISGMKYTQTIIASSLNQLSNVFIFIGAAVFLHEKLTLRKIIGLMLASIGAFAVVFKIAL